MCSQEGPDRTGEVQGVLLLSGGLADQALKVNGAVFVENRQFPFQKCVFCWRRGLDASLCRVACCPLF